MEDPARPRETHGLCTVCGITVMPCDHPRCPRCGLPYTGAAGPDHDCDDCRRSPPPFSTARSAFLYGGAVHDLITSFKYAGRIHAGETLTRMALEAGSIDDLVAGCAAAVPVPLHLSRLFTRGFNQAAVISRSIACAHGLAYDPRTLARVVRTPAQAALTRSERAKNLEGAFEASNPKKLSGKTLLLVDDVFTTGATAAACARTLLDAGAGEVRVFTLARTA